jgi:hypothetical protein
MVKGHFLGGYGDELNFLSKEAKYAVFVKTWVERGLAKKGPYFRSTSLLRLF